MEDVCRDFILHNKEFTKIKKEKVVLKNLVTIINATLKLSNEKGFQNMSVRDLCKESGLSMGALYSYFPGKVELLTMIHDQGNHVVLGILQEQLNLGGHPREKLRRLICTHLYVSELMRDWFYFFYMETKNLSRADRKKPIKSELMTEEMCISILEEGQEQNVFSIDNMPLTGSAMKALFQDWYLKRWKYASRKTSVEEYALFVINFVEAYIM
ncbi:MAG: TetR/AcrR family transcriptional regulator [bacterium]|nr:TetR/AcrR family transcriptional regulator [bacterium]